MEYMEWKWVLLISMGDFELLVLILTNGGPFEPKSKRRKCFQFLTWSLPDAVLRFEWIGLLFFCWSIVWRRKTHDSNVFHCEPKRGFICVFIPFLQQSISMFPNTIKQISYMICLFIYSPQILFVFCIWHSIFPISTSVIFSFWYKLGRHFFCVN